ncbi:kinase-like protein [Hypoxylon rubiginosum]|uniref:Kinase-like protein n=1 Tax=Hypoxylon rubiginosum TaxID=110542 RepID=A0ACC0DCM6_9PEZI|nr:kinase-like protein [Hypoxylon rubiginosum]
MLILNPPPGAKALMPAGYSCICYMPERPDEIIKVPLPIDVCMEAHEIEKQIFSRLGKHKSIVNFVKSDEHGIYLDRAKYGCLRLYYMEGGTASLTEKTKWCHDVAEALEYVHQKNVRHADLSGRNLLIDSARNILLCDFAGSSIDDKPAIVRAEPGYRHPDEAEWKQPTIRSEIHSLGSVIFEIMTGKKPHDGLEEHEIVQLIEQGKYPDVSNVPLNDTIEKCWKGVFQSAAEVAQVIASQIASQPVPVKSVQPGWICECRLM